MAHFTKLWSQILDSTVWTQTDNDFRVLWITILAKKDKDHIVRASIPGLAAAANISPEKCEQYLEKLMAPDKWSGNKEFEGRRLLRINDGWLVVSGQKYQDYMRQEQRNEAVANAMKRYRAKKKGANAKH